MRGSAVRISWFVSGGVARGLQGDRVRLPNSLAIIHELMGDPEPKSILGT
jgi:hypothetical protein